MLVTLPILTAACTISETPAPPLTGPSEYALSLSVSVEPDLWSDATVWTRQGSS